MERETALHLENLDAALVLMTKIGVLFNRLEEKVQQTQLGVVAKQIINVSSGGIVDQKLNSHFTYLKSLVNRFSHQNQY